MNPGLWTSPTEKAVIMNFELPPEVLDYLSRLDAFVNETILPLQRKHGNERFFDHRREFSRTQWHN